MFDTSPEGWGRFNSHNDDDNEELFLVMAVIIICSLILAWIYL